MDAALGVWIDYCSSQILSVQYMLELSFVFIAAYKGVTIH